jgi:hypothetical protein
MSTAWLNELEERFLRYVKIDTTADPTSSTSPSTAIQFNLLHLLMEELREIGAQDVSLTDYGAVLATIPATVATATPTIAGDPRPAGMGQPARHGSRDRGVHPTRAALGRGRTGPRSSATRPGVASRHGRSRRLDGCDIRLRQGCHLFRKMATLPPKWRLQ